MGTQSLDFKSGLDDSKFQAGLRRMETGAKASAGKISGLMKGFSVAAAGAALLKGAMGGLDFAGDLQDSAAEVNMNIEAFQGLSGAFALSGTRQDQFTRAMFKLNVAMETAKTETGAERDAFDALGISFGSIAESTPDEMLLQLAAAMNENVRLGKDTTAIYTLLGTRAGKMAATLKAGRPELEKQAASIEKLSAAEAAALDSTGDAKDRAIFNLKVKASKGLAAAAVALTGQPAVAPASPARGSALDPRLAAAEEERLKKQKKLYELEKKTGEERLNNAEEELETTREELRLRLTAREELRLRLMGVKPERQTSKEKRVARQMEEAENPKEREKGLRKTGGLGSGLDKAILFSSSTPMGNNGLKTGGLGAESKSRSTKTGSGKALARFQKSQDEKKASEAGLDITNQLLKNIEKALN